MSKVLNWMFTAILLCGTVCGFTSCGSDDDDEAVDVFTLVWDNEVVEEGNLTEVEIYTLERSLHQQYNTQSITLSEAKANTDKAAQNLAKDIKEQRWYAMGCKYYVYVKLYNSKEELVYSKQITVIDDQITIE
jgi:hypothetical protein